MVITGAFFCEAAATYEQKLNVLGGVWDWLYVGDLGDGVDLSPTLVALIQREVDESNPSKVTMTVRGPDGTTVRAGHIEYGAPEGTALGFFHIPVTFRAQNYGRYVVELAPSAGTPAVVALNIARSPDDRS